MYAERLSSTLPRVRATLAEAAIAGGRDPAEVRLVAVTKGHPPEAVAAALAAGLHDLGENRVEELEPKRARFAGADVRWHLIGHVQSRKAGRAVLASDLIHSVDSARLAARLAGAAAEARRPAPAVLLQVNTSGEEAKSGFPWAHAEDDVLAVLETPGLEVLGLMTMAPLTDAEPVLRATFRRLRELSERVRRHDARLGGELSMGMTNDMHVAVAEGSTIVRVGTALFGEAP